MRRTVLLLTTMALALLLAGAPALAAPTDQSALCENPQRVLDPVTLNGDSTTSSFTTTTSGFRVNYDGGGFDPAPNSTAEISIRGVAGFSETVDANADTSVFFNLPPGTYRVEVNLNPGPEVDPDSKFYIVSVDQCGETTTNCQDPQQVLTVGPTNRDSRTTFTTTGKFFRVNYEVDFNADTAADNAAEIRIERSSGGVVASLMITEDANDSFFVNASPGTYELVVSIDPPNAATYTVTVDDCGETTTAPKVISTFPRNGGEVGPAANVTATFSEDMQEASVIDAFKLFRKGSTNQIDAVVTYNAATRTATLNPTNNLKRGATYKAVVTTVAEDVAGNQLDQNSSKSGLQQKVWFFEIDN